MSVMRGDVHPMHSGHLPGVSVTWAAVLVAALLVTPAARAQAGAPTYDPRAAFREADSNHDGAVDHVEFETRMTEVFYFADTDKDGALSQTEAPATLVQTDNLTAADPNKDGKLTVHEFTRARMQDYEWADTNDNGLLELDEVVGAYQPQTNFLVQGFADSTGSEATNQQLSLTRAQVVAAYLGEQGIAPARMDVQGFGTTSAADSNATAAGRRNNRRVEVTVR